MLRQDTDETWTNGKTNNDIGIGRLNITEGSILPELIYNFKHVSNKNITKNFF